MKGAWRPFEHGPRTALQKGGDDRNETDLSKSYKGNRVLDAHGEWEL